MEEEVWEGGEDSGFGETLRSVGAISWKELMLGREGSYIIFNQ